MDKGNIKLKEVNKHKVIDTALLDVHRKVPKAEGGELTAENVEVIKPVEHMKLHGNLRERTEELEKLKMLIDAREQRRKAYNSANNRILAYKRRTDNLDEETIADLKDQVTLFEKQLRKHDKKIQTHLKSMSMPIVKKAMDIVGIGPITVAYLVAYVDIHKAQYASSLVSYVGFDKPSHERYTKGEAGGGNKTLRTVLYTTATSIEKNVKSPYRVVYENEKKKLAASQKITKSRNTQGKLIECMWKDAKPGHRRGAALRKLLKHFLADFWFVWRTLEGLETRPLYVEEKLGHKGIVRPEERGWKLD